MLFYQKLYDRPFNDRVLNEEKLSLSVMYFQTYSVHISGRVKDFNRNQHKACIFRATLNPFQYPKDLLYLEGNSTPRCVWEANSTTFNVVFVQNVVPEYLST